jgi:aldehyde dehydrogenase (NAD+)
MPEIFKNYINGEWVPAVSGETFANHNPSKIGEVIGLFPRSGGADVEKAVAAAAAAFREWKNVPPPERGRILQEAGKIMAGRKAELARIISRENGKTVSGAMGDVQSGIDMA